MVLVAYIKGSWQIMFVVVIEGVCSVSRSSEFGFSSCLKEKKILLKRINVILQNINRVLFTIVTKGL